MYSASLSQPNKRVDLSISILLIGLCNGAHRDEILILLLLPRVVSQ